MYNNRSNMQGNRRGGGGGGRYYHQGPHQRNHNRPNNNQGNRFQGNNAPVKNEPVKSSPSKPTPSPSSVKNSVSPVKQEHKEMKKVQTPPPPKPATMPANAPQNRQFQPPPQQQPQQENDGSRPLEKKFTQRSRLFVGNLPINTTDDQFKDLFKKYGEISETFVNSAKGFGFVRLDTRANAEKAKWELDGFQIKNRQLRVRFASHGAALSIKHLSPFVSNELLEGAFSQFGPVERAVVIVDDRGKPTGRGIVEFARKSSATKALQQISEGCFLLTSSPQAIVVKPLEQEDTEDGQSEKNILRNPQYFQEREAPPRFAQPGTFEHKFALRWKALDEMERQQQEQLDKSIQSAREKLEREMDNAIHDHQTIMMKEDLRRRQEELDRLEQARQREVERRKQMEFAREDQNKKELEALAKRQEILRQQVEGTYAMPGMSPTEQSRNQGPPRTGPGPGFGNSMMQDALALEMMVGSQGGGLGPAPVPKPHSARCCPLLASNMTKIIGDSRLIRKEENFFKVLSQHSVDSETEKCRRNDSPSLGTFYSLISHCPHVNSCQTLNQWKFQMMMSKINRMFARRSLRAPELILYFVPIGPFPEFIHEFKDQSLNRNLFQLMGAFLKSFFPGSILRHLPEIHIDDIPTTNRNHELTGKKQYHVSGILTYLQKQLPPDGFAIVGLSWHDMYPCDKLNFVLGQGSSQHSACVSSFGRFDPNYVKGFKGREDGILPHEMKDVTMIDDEVLWKLMKVLSHETCHVFGITHCRVFQCLMNESLSTEEAMCQPMYLCPLCMSKILHLQTMLRTSVEPGQATIKSHFASLLEFLQSTFSHEDAGDRITNKRIIDTITWLKNMVEYL